MRCRFAVLFLAAALATRLPSAQGDISTNFNRPEGTRAVSNGVGAGASSQLRELALDNLKERFPNVDPSCFLYQGTITDLAAGRNYREATVVFTDCHSPIKYAKGPKQDGQAVPIVSGIEYYVRMKRDGELIGIERHEHNDGVLEITPAPDQGIQSRVPAPPIAPPLQQIPLPLVQTNTIIIIRPEAVPQTLP
jgi:hypothetical protein